MRFTVPLQYSATFRLPRRRTDNHATMAGEALVTVRDVPTDEAPVVAVAADVSGHEPGLAPRGGRGRRLVTYGGGFWRELMSEPDFRAMVERRWEAGERDDWDAKRVDNPFANGDRGRSSCWVPGIDATTRAAVEAEHGAVRDWIDDGGRAAAQAAQMAANRAIAVAGVLYERCDEPCWRVWREGEEVVVGFGFAIPEEAPADLSWNWAPQIFKEHRFAATRGDDAIAFARRWAAAAGRVRVRVAAQARIALPDAFALDDDSASLLAAATVAVLKCGGGLNAVPRAAGRAWYALRDALERSDGCATPELGEAASGFAAAWSGVHPSRLGGGDEFGDSSYDFTASGDAASPAASVEAVSLAADRWALRPADGREWAHLGWPVHRSAADGVEAIEITTLAMARGAGAALGVDVSAEAQAAADGRLRLVVAVAGPQVLGLAVVDQTGMIERAFGPGGRGLPAGAARAVARLSAANAAEMTPPTTPSPRA